MDAQQQMGLLVIGHAVVDMIAIGVVTVVLIRMQRARGRAQRLLEQMEITVPTGSKIILSTEATIAGTIPEERCCVCEARCDNHCWMCDQSTEETTAEKEPPLVWCENCWPDTPCGSGEHGVECPTQVWNAASAPADLIARTM